MKESERKLKAAQNQAAYWHAFAYLAVRGKRTFADFQTTMFWASVTAPEDDLVANITAEAKEAAKS